MKKAFPVLEGLSQNPAVAEVLESERPQHKVRITKSFYIGASNVTLPLGVSATLDLSDVGNPQMHLLEASVTV